MWEATEAVLAHEEGNTIIRVVGGGLETYDAAGFDFVSAPVNPVRPDPRYSLDLRALGRLERLAKGKRRRKYTVDDRHSLFLNLWTSPTNLVTSFFIYNSCGLGCCWQSVI